MDQLVVFVYYIDFKDYDQKGLVRERYNDVKKHFSNVKPPAGYTFIHMIMPIVNEDKNRVECIYPVEKGEQARFDDFVNMANAQIQKIEEWLQQTCK